MSCIGSVFNKALSKSINVYIAESGSGFRRLTGVIDNDVKATALAKVKDCFESGTLFKDDDMKQIEQVIITNMSHQSNGDANAHYSVQGETAAGIKVKGGHAAEDSSKQTRAN